jgi:hypothetical protein
LKQTIKDQESLLKTKDLELEKMKMTQISLEDEIKNLKEKITTLETQSTISLHDISAPVIEFTTPMQQIEISGLDSSDSEKKENLDDFDTPKEGIEEVITQPVEEPVVDEIKSIDGEIKTPVKLRKRKLVKKNVENDLDTNTLEKN